MMVATIVLAAWLSNNVSADAASSMLVLTGRRTRDWSAPNAYIMPSPNEDQYSRLYSCMMQAEIVHPTTSQPFRSTVAGYRTDAEGVFNCGLESDRGWPKDYGFVRCLQKRFKATYHQSNVFLKCLELSEGPMVESIQTRSSTLFLGSYNFVALLVASLGVITSFLIFTAGGGFVSNDDNWDNKNGHIKGLWNPLSVGNVIYAMIWSFLMLGAALFYTFPLNDMWSDIPAVEGRKGFPTTPWGGYVCSLVYLGTFGYFLGYFIEWMNSDKANQVTNVTATVGYSSKIPSLLPTDLVVATPSMAPSRTYDQDIDFQPVSSVQSFRSVSPFAVATADQRAVGLQPYNPNVDNFDMPVVSSSRSDTPFPVRGGGVARVPTMPRVPTWQGEGGERSSPQLERADSLPRRVRSFRSQFIGVRADTYSYLHFAKEEEHLRFLPYINKAFACTWVFADSLLFVGMLNAQNSMLNENVVAVFYYIFLCRAFQFAGTLFIDRVLFDHKEVAAQGNILLAPQQDRVHTKHEANIVTACCQLCSLWCYILVVFNFFITMGYPMALSQDMGVTQTLALQISFLVIMTILELVRHILVFWTLLFSLSLKTFQSAARWIYLVDCVLRTVLIISTALVISQALGDQNATLYDFLKLRTA